MFDSIESIQNASVINTDNGGHQIACCHKTIIIDLHSITIEDTTVYLIPCLVLNLSRAKVAQLKIQHLE